MHELSSLSSLSGKVNLYFISYVYLSIFVICIVSSVYSAVRVYYIYAHEKKLSCETCNLTDDEYKFFFFFHTHCSIILHEVEKLHV